MADKRAKDYKNQGRDTREMRGRRVEEKIELRKNSRNEQILKRRNITDVPDFPAPLGDSQKVNLPKSVAVTLADLDSIVEGVCGNDSVQQLEAVTKCRMLLSKEKNPPIDSVIQTGLVPHLINFLTRDENGMLQFEAAWTLTNIASGTSEHTRIVAQAGAVPLLVKLLQSSNEDVREQAVWALGNIAGDGSELRDHTLAAGILPYLLYILQPGVSKASMQRNATWTLSNLCRGKSPQPDFQTIKVAIPALAHLIYSSDEEVLADATWALSYLTDGDNYKIEEVIQAHVIPRLIELLQHPNHQIITPALRAIGNVVTGSDSQTQHVLDAGALFAFHSMLSHSKDIIRKETCWTLSNITAGSTVQIQSVIDAQIIPALVQCLLNADTRTKKEAVWAIFNLCTGGTSQQIQHVVEQGCIKPLVDILATPDCKQIQCVLDTLTHILRVGAEFGSERNPCADWIDEAGGVERIEKLQNHENEDIYVKALNIIEKYYGEEEVESGGDYAQTGAQFNFQTTAPVGAGGFSF